MRIAYFVDEFPALSLTFVLEEITALLRRDHDVEIFAGGCTSLVPIGCDSSSCFPNSSAHAQAAAGQQLYVRVGGESGANTDMMIGRPSTVQTSPRLCSASILASTSSSPSTSSPRL